MPARLAHLRAAATRRPGPTAFVVFFLASTCWSLATPLYASPDEPSHVLRAYSVAHGQVLGRDPGEHSGGILVVRVPAFLANAKNVGCYAFVETKSAVCHDIDDHDTRTREEITGAGRHPPWYYAVVGLPTLVFESNFGVRLVRLVGALLCSVMIGLAFGTARRHLSDTWATIGLVAAVTPMVLFLAGVVNPNGLEIAAAALVWVAGMALVRSPEGTFDRATIDRLGVGAVVLALARHLGPLWVALIGLALLAWGGVGVLRSLWRVRRARWWLAGVTAACAVQVVWIQVVGAFEIGADQSHLLGLSLGDRVQGSFGRVYVLFEQMIGYFGWFDTRSPMLTYFTWTVLLGVALGLVTALGRRRALLTTLGVLAATIVVPVLLEVPQVNKTGYFWQGRYTLPIAVGIPLLALGSVRARKDAAALRVTLVVGVLVVVAQLGSFLQTLRRYTVGTSGPELFLGHEEWSPPLGSVVLILGFALAIVAWVLLDRLPDQPTSAADPPLDTAG